MQKIVILDRDGVINFDSEAYVKSAEEWIPIPGSIEAIAQLKKAGFKVFIATNQSGIGRGYYGLEELNAMHQKCSDLLAEYQVSLDGIYFCPHLPDAQCRCRKPAPGMIESIAQEHDLDVTQAYFVGDSKRDLDAGLAAGAKPVLVLTGNGQKTVSQIDSDIPVFDDLSAFVSFVLR
ncbi:MAG: D-glycero-beta-D-manno-heptose-1,7-bisphosphate 7-phosphatase [Gammaproteobacteria bacterium]|nr:D-glycero-beta-D-manno-heptose-1,7-bisphosphate 7-phosphatase [Gammaproteobacteria bacterium]HBF08176.1 D-glycero-beta-D-manno-heptose-1,7-bisphosphate 7-phosphatase [Gammaproteobacteria bacterium]|tara:strand:- start:399 stop:929 length:531 start_codon:yes stop_codon:yes gene_type:complete